MPARPPGLEAQPLLHYHGDLDVERSYYCRLQLIAERRRASAPLPEDHPGAGEVARDCTPHLHAHVVTSPYITADVPRALFVLAARVAILPGRNSCTRRSKSGKRKTREQYFSKGKAAKVKNDILFGRGTLRSVHMCAKRRLH